MGKNNERDSAPAMAPDVFEFLDYRQFLDSLVRHLKSKNQFSVRKFAQKVGFGSSSFLKMVLDSKRNLSRESGLRIAEAFRFSRKETEYFLKLIEFNQAKNLAEKELRFNELRESHRFKSIQLLASDQYDFFAHWYIVAILEGIGTKWSQKSPAEMARSLGIRESQVLDGLKLLERLGLIVKAVRGYRRRDQSLETPDQLQGMTLRNFHREMMAKAFSCIDDFPPEVRDVGSLTLAVSEQEFREIREKLQKLRRDLNEQYSNSRKPKRVYQLNLQLFPLFSLE